MSFKDQFVELSKKSIEDQGAFFRERYVFKLGQERYTEVKILEAKFKHFLKRDDGKADSMSPAVAADFMQNLGKTRTATQRKAELADVDVNQDGRTSFLEYLILHFKIMILEEFFARKGAEPDVDMTTDGIGLTGVGDRLIEELFAPPQGVDLELEKMIRDFAQTQLSTATKMADLEAIVEAGGVKGMGAKTELDKLKNADQTTANGIQARIKAATQKANKAAKEKCAEFDPVSEPAVTAALKTLV